MKIESRLRAALEATGLEWRLESLRRRVRLVVGGRVVGVLPRGAGRERGCCASDTVAAARRVARELGR